MEQKIVPGIVYTPFAPERMRGTEWELRDYVLVDIAYEHESTKLRHPAWKAYDAFNAEVAPRLQGNLIAHYIDKEDGELCINAVLRRRPSDLLPAAFGDISVNYIFLEKPWYEKTLEQPLPELFTPAQRVD